MPQVVIMKMSAAYEGQDFYRDAESFAGCTVVPLEAQGISGTDCFCDEQAKEQLRRMIRDLPPTGLHFLDSGNYHYLSLLWMEKISEPFDLALMDFHPDLQPPRFGKITSCGSWVLEAVETLPCLQNVYIYGVDLQLLDECEPPPGKVHVCRWGQPLPGEYPVYLSLDKDVMARRFARSDWSQGDAVPEQITDLMERIYTSRPVIGMDICGECAGDITSEADRINNDTNRILLRRWADLLGKY